MNIRCSEFLECPLFAAIRAAHISVSIHFQRMSTLMFPHPVCTLMLLTSFEGTIDLSSLFSNSPKWGGGLVLRRSFLNFQSSSRSLLQWLDDCFLSSILHAKKNISAISYHGLCLHLHSLWCYRELCSQQWDWDHSPSSHSIQLFLSNVSMVEWVWSRPRGLWIHSKT